MKSPNCVAMTLALVMCGQWVLSGVARQETNASVKAIVSQARSYVDGTAWTPPGAIAPADIEQYKGLFIADVLRKAGAAPWQPGAAAPVGDPTPSQWADPSFEIKGWTVVFAPDKAEGLTARQILGLYRKPGDVVAQDNRVGIVVDERHTISVSPKGGRVERSYWSFGMPDATEYGSGATFEQAAKAMVAKFTVRRFAGVS